MLTTVVGSYPVILKDPTSLGSKIAKIFGSYDQFIPALELAVRDQINAGIDVISDGQVRGDMIDVFARNIPGMVVEDNIPKILSKITPANQSIGAHDLEIALKIANKISKDFAKSSNNRSKLLVEDDFNINFKGIKGIITGPTTLVLSSRIEGFYKRDKKEKIIKDMAMALRKEVEYLQEAGAAMIQIDEPFLSTGVADLLSAKNAIKIITNNLEIPVSMHVCGNIGEVLKDILNFPVQIIDCEFAGIPANIQTLEQEYDGSKKIGFGCVDTKVDGVEKVDKVVNLLKKGLEIIGEENMIVDPDCGMRMLSRDAALLKLKNMTEAVGWL
jgi:5-methyltetrahydropteroyltriglutamate--homocysteine methyltransferase